MSTMSFINLDLSKQAQALEVIFSRTAKSHHSQTCLRIYLNEKLNFYHHILVRNALMYIRIENLVYYKNIFINFRIYRNQ